VTLVAKVARKLSSNLLNAAINFDRLCASLGGAPVDYTISGEAGKHAATNPIAHATEAVLDRVQPEHCETANAEDQAITTARTAFEQGNHK
jgi:hypothetical protein